jgi:hypothetical protein
MPIDYEIDHARRLVFARGRGIFADADVFAYQREVWSRPEVAGYDELVDMTEVEEIAIPTLAGPRIQQLAGEAAAQDHPTSAGKLAIVAPVPSRLAWPANTRLTVNWMCAARSRSECSIVWPRPCRSWASRLGKG